MIRVYVIDMKREFYYLQWDDPTTGRRITRSSKCKTRRDAERAALQKEKELAEGHGVYGRQRWKDFVSRYHMEHLSSLAVRSESKALSVLDSYERRMQPMWLDAINSASISTYAAKLRSDGLREATIAAHLRTLRAALAWAKEKGFIGIVPQMPKIRRAAGGRMAKGRPLSASEFAKMLRATRDVVGENWRAWVRLQRGLWLSGLRLGEAMQLRWNPGNHPSVDLTGSGWILIPASCNKSHRDERLPMTQDFAAWLRRRPEKAGLVLAPECSENRATKVISAIGAAAKIVTDHATGRTATAHDLRRSFAQRWAAHLSVIDLQRLMRHGSIETTRSYYLDADSEGLAARLVNFQVNTSRK